MRTWLRVTLPSDWTVGVFILLYAVLEYLHWKFAGPGIPNAPQEFLIEMTAIFYAASRVFLFHPVFNSDYHKWLAAVPWTARKPLPAGPVHLVVQDVVLVGSLVAIAWLRHPEINLARLGINFLMMYELALAISFVFLARPWVTYAIIFGFGLIVLTWHMPLVALGVAGGLYVVSLAGLVRSLQDFENWDLSWLEEQPLFSMSQQKALDRLRKNILGWPFDSIRPRDVAASIPYRDGTMISLSFGWWAFVILQRIGPQIANAQPQFWQPFLFGMLGLPLAIARIGIYCWGYASPISFWGRVFTLRWIVPGYDLVVLAPLATLGSAVAGGELAYRFPAYISLIVPVTLILAGLCTFNLGPSLKRWRLTGNHRLSPAILMANKRAEVQQV